MGYDIHITRRENWFDNETNDISLDEWINYINSDEELRLTNGYSIKDNRFEMPGFCEWHAHPTEIEQDAMPWFSYWEGCIDTKNPDMPTIRKMIQIATALGAQVQGDDGELYTEEYLTEMENLEANSSSGKQIKQKHWWKFW